ncbi:hypothetical protein CSKR_200318 [Clonorchis sinensis]|uniref:Uncharacterized protein n=1 Tax=Clonorchis sinensis TaxID=79923 RepID=A0A8T1MBV7_CLOSI|nr:hypothetical protein CSKR_200318 [Clonorchis sinensis]
MERAPVNKESMPSNSSTRTITAMKKDIMKNYHPFRNFLRSRPVPGNAELYRQYPEQGDTDVYFAAPWRPREAVFVNTPPPPTIDCISNVPPSSVDRCN